MPIVVLEDIFLRVGQISDEELNKLRQVCTTWNEIIINKLRGKNPSTEWGRIIAGRIKNHLENGNLLLAEITCAASLAHGGHLNYVRYLELWDVNLFSISAEHLASLVSSVTKLVSVKNVSGCCLVTMLDSVKSENLGIGNQSLGSEETQALVRAMESEVVLVELDEGVTLDIGVLTQYS